MISIIASSLQLSGALILLLNSFGKLRERVLASLFSTISFVRRDEKGKVIIPKDKLIKATKQLYLNRMSFFYLSLGFIMEMLVSSKPSIPILLKLCYSILFCAFFLFIGFMVACIKANRNIKDGIKETYEELKEEVQEDIITSISKEERDEIFGNT